MTSSSNTFITQQNSPQATYSQQQSSSSFQPQMQPVRAAPIQQHSISLQLVQQGGVQQQQQTRVNPNPVSFQTQGVGVGGRVSSITTASNILGRTQQQPVNTPTFQPRGPIPSTPSPGSRPSPISSLTNLSPQIHSTTTQQQQQQQYKQQLQQQASPMQPGRIGLPILPATHTRGGTGSVVPTGISSISSSGPVGIGIPGRPAGVPSLIPTRSSYSDNVNNRVGVLGSLPPSRQQQGVRDGRDPSRERDNYRGGDRDRERDRDRDRRPSLTQSPRARSPNAANRGPVFTPVHNHWLTRFPFYSPSRDYFQIRLRYPKLYPVRDFAQVVNCWKPNSEEQIPLDQPLSVCFLPHRPFCFPNAQSSERGTALSTKVFWLKRGRKKKRKEKQNMNLNLKMKETKKESLTTK